MTDEEPNGRIDDPDEDRAVAAFLDAVAPTLRDEAVWVEPPAGLADSIIAAIAAERAARPAERSGPTPTAVPTAPRPVARHLRRRSRATWWIGAAAAAAVAALAVGIVVTRGDGEPDRSSSPSRAPSSTRTPRRPPRWPSCRNGAAIELDVHEPRPGARGVLLPGLGALARTVRRSPSGRSTCAAATARVTLWSGVDVDEYPTLTVTLQEEGAGPESSGEVVLRGSIVP